MKSKVFLIFLLCTLSIGCVPTLPVNPVGAGQINKPTLQTKTVAYQSATPDEPSPTNTPTPKPKKLWLDASIPLLLRESLHLNPEMRMAASPEEATLHLGVAHTSKGTSEWIYALVAPFPTVIDGLSQTELLNFWKGEDQGPFLGKPLMLSAETLSAFESMWGKPGDGRVRILDEKNLLDTAWKDQPSWALVPFEGISPRWKVMRLDGISPLDRDFDPNEYPLVARFGLMEGPAPEWVSLPTNNRDPHKLTVVLMTGVTALVRALGVKMEKEGMTFPGEKIKGWLRSADFTHVSNEVSFDALCPPAKPYQKNLMFCSRPEYIQLLKYVGVNIVELSGNHLMDFREQSLPYTMDLYKQNQMSFYASGMNIEEARQPLLLEHNGNKIAFIGCNPAGPPLVWATQDRPGAADCDYDWMKAEIRTLKEKGYLVITTLQFYENYSPTVGDTYERRDFVPLAEAGSVIVSGSQAHYPKGFEFVGDSLIHYGLGNLFFDQMYVPDNTGPELYNPKDLPVPGTRLEFLDRHVFYDGRYIGTELLTAMLDAYSQPRPMTEQERDIFLRDTFKYSHWIKP